MASGAVLDAWITTALDLGATPLAAAGDPITVMPAS
jgi:hypothetical protein